MSSSTQALIKALHIPKDNQERFLRPSDAFKNPAKLAANDKTKKAFRTVSMAGSSQSGSLERTLNISSQHNAKRRKQQLESQIMQINLRSLN